MIAVTMETRTTQEAAGISKCPVSAGLLTPGEETNSSFTNTRLKAFPEGGSEHEAIHISTAEEDVRFKHPISNMRR